MSSTVKAIATRRPHWVRRRIAVWSTCVAHGSKLSCVRAREDSAQPCQRSPLRRLPRRLLDDATPHELPWIAGRQGHARRQRALHDGVGRGHPPLPG